MIFRGTMARAVIVCSITGAALYAQKPAAMLDKYCTGCHNDKLKSGGLALDTASLDNVGKHAEDWEKVVRKLRPRYMPPAGLPRPDERGYESLISTLETSLDRLPPNPGRTDTFRRLNRTEYHNSIRDLLALDVDVTAL